MSKITVPELSLVVMIGVSGSGKSTFTRKHFKPTEVLSSDYCRGLVSDDENNQVATKDAFEVLHFIAAKRLAAGKLTVVDATNVQQEARKPLVALAREYHCLPVAIVLNLPEKVCQERNQNRPDRQFGRHVIPQQVQQLRRSIRNLKNEGFRHIFVLESLEEVEAVVIERQKLWSDRKELTGPFDIIGDIHGCFDELTDLLSKLGYQFNEDKTKASHPEGRRVAFLGDLVDRGPKTPQVLRLVMNMVKAETALCVPGNHDIKLMKKLRGQDVKITHGLAESIEQLAHESDDFRKQTSEFIDDLVSHAVLDGGKLVIAHAGMKAEMQGRGSGHVRSFALFGETTGETDEYGLPVRYNWAADYRGQAMVVYGHTPVPEAEWLNRTICIDTGCVFGGKLTALRYPEKEIISVPALRTYYESVKPLIPTKTQTLTAQQVYDDVLYMEDIQGKRIIQTRYRNTVTLREENTTAALEVMSRFAANPKWLIYLPPTMSPCETSDEEGVLEHPQEALNYYKKAGVQKVVCEQKHMGSRMVIVTCRTEEVARTRFGVIGDGVGICYTRTGRRFFDKNLHWEKEILALLNKALDACDFWKDFGTDWLCLDVELMPWSAKAQELLVKQYAPVGTAGLSALADELAALEVASEKLTDLKPMVTQHAERLSLLKRFREAYQHYCWPVNDVNDFKVAPFHILATEGKVHTDRDHVWHMEQLAKICDQDQKILFKTPFQVVDLEDSVQVESVIQWWKTLTESGGEGMVVKPFQFIATNNKGLLQPAVKCRGREYLRIIYGPEYTLPENLKRLRARGLSVKRSLALREFALGLEALERFVAKEPLRRVHECVFGVLAMESEPVDPRL